MFYDENLTKTKAFKEQLDQHATLFSSHAKRSPSFQEYLKGKTSQALITLNKWVKTFIHTIFNLKSNVPLKK
jgi:hypothetical protein